MIFYLIIFIIILLLCLRAYIRIKHGFWSIQPVIHSYDLFKIFYKSGIINNDLPEINKYCDFLNIQTFKYDSLQQKNLDLIHSFIFENYLNNEIAKYNITNKYFNSCFKGHNGSSFITVYGEFSFLDSYFNIENKEKEKKMHQLQNINGVITGRPINLTIKNLTKLPVYYIDFLCVSKNKRKNGLASNLIQTHEYNQRHSNQKVNVCLFKKEGDLVGIVPLVIFNNCLFDISNELTNIITQTYSQIKYLFINEINFYLFIDFLINNYYLFDCVAIVEPSNILELIKSEHLFIIVGVLNENIISSFIFKDYNVIYNNEKSIQLESSIINPDYLDNIIEYFTNSISILNKKLNAKHILIESLSNNSLLLDKLSKKNINPKYSIKAAYFLYNYCQTPILPEKSFFLM